VIPGLSKKPTGMFLSKCLRSLSSTNALKSLSIPSKIEADFLLSKKSAFLFLASASASESIEDSGNCTGYLPQSLFAVGVQVLQSEGSTS
jgi:hypothetical protein